jgi:hypothetical protein
VGDVENDPCICQRSGNTASGDDLDALLAHLRLVVDYQRMREYVCPATLTHWVSTPGSSNTIARSAISACVPPG